MAHSLILFAQKLKTVSDVAANDSDKSFTVPVGKRWIINTVWVELTTTSTSGNRQMVVEVQSAAGDVLLQARAGAVIAASGAGNFLFATGVADLTSVRDTSYLSTPIPAPLEMDAGEVLRVYDSGPDGAGGIDAAADDMIVHLRHYEQYDV